MNPDVAMNERTRHLPVVAWSVTLWRLEPTNSQQFPFDNTAAQVILRIVQIQVRFHLRHGSGPASFRFPAPVPSIGFDAVVMELRLPHPSDSTGEAEVECANRLSMAISARRMVWPEAFTSPDAVDPVQVWRRNPRQSPEWLACRKNSEKTCEVEWLLIQ